MELVSISLLPPEFRQIAVVRQKQRRLLVSFAFITLLLLAIVGALAINLKIANIQLESTLAYRKMLEGQLQALAVYEEPFERLTHLSDIKQEITAGQMDWSGTLVELGRHVPEGVWLTDFRGTVVAAGNDGPPKGEIVLRGEATDHLLVSQFLERLRNLTLLSNVKCHFSIAGSSQLAQFEITASVSTFDQENH